MKKYEVKMAGVSEKNIEFAEKYSVLDGKLIFYVGENIVSIYAISYLLWIRDKTEDREIIKS